MSAAAKKPPARNAHAKLRARVANTIVMVPDTDWAAILAGEKRMFRSYSRRNRPALLPTPIVAYRFGLADRLEHTVLYLEDTWQEPLGSISPEDLAEEGFATMSEFRRYFDARYPKGGFRPLAPVQVYRIRPVTQGDLDEFAERLLHEMGYAR